MYLSTNMITTASLIFFLPAFILAEEVPSARYKVLAAVYTYLQPDSVKVNAVYDMTVLFQQVSKPNDPRTVYHGKIEDFRLTVKNIEANTVKDKTNCKSLATEIKQSQTPFIAYYDKGLFQYAEIAESDTDFAINVKMRIFLLLGSYNILKNNKPVTVKENFINGPCDVNYKNIELIPNPPGYIFEAEKDYVTTTCTEYNNNNLTLGPTCNAAADNEKAWKLKSSVGGYISGSPFSGLMSAKIIEEFSFKPWKGSSQTANFYKFIDVELLGKFNSSLLYDVSKQKTKRMHKIPDRTLINVDSAKGKGDNDFKKLYHAFTCSNMNNENYHANVLALAAKCEV